jgi:hypothetical protein
MKIQMSKPTILTAAFLALGISFSFGSPTVWAATLNGSDDVFSFDMWCQEMKLYPAQRCMARQPADLKAYDQYRTTAERYAEQRAQQTKRDQQLNQKLNSDPLSRQRTPLGR